MQELKHRNYSLKSLLNVKQPFFSLNSQHSYKYKVESMCNKQGAHSSLSGSKISVWNIYFANKTLANLLISNNIFFGKKGYRVQSTILPESICNNYVRPIPKCSPVFTTNFFQHMPFGHLDPSF